MPDETYYSLLEIPETASTAEIRSAYLRLIREVHPDRLANAPAYWLRQAEEKSKEINEAYAMLSNREKRHLYDLQLASYRGSSGPNSQSQASPPANTTKQGSYTPHSTQQKNQAGSRPSNAAKAPTQTSNQVSTSRMTGGQRLYFAFVMGIFGLSMAGGFWTSSSFGNAFGLLFLSTASLFGVACLYQGQMSRVLLRLRVRTKRKRLATLGIIVLVLLLGKIANMNRGTPVRGMENPAASAVRASEDKIVAANHPASAVRASHQEQRPRRFDARQIMTKSGPETVAPPRQSLQTSQQPSLEVSAQKSLPANAPLATSPVTSIAAQQEKVEALWQKSLAGSWVGKYTCAQGVTGLTLTIADGGLSGTFDFYPLPGGSQFPQGLYSGTVTASQDGSFEFEPQTWISQPQGFTAVALSGHYLADAQRIQGQVTGMAGCTSFVVSRQRGQVRNPPAADDISSLTASDRGSIESACTTARLVQGAAAYHRCLDSQVEELGRNPAMPDLSKLNEVDRRSVESACTTARLVQGAAAYHRCLNTQVEELGRYPAMPNLSKLNEVDRRSIESACASARLVQGAASYHQCLARQLSELGIQ